MSWFVLVYSESEESSEESFSNPTPTKLVAEEELLNEDLSPESSPVETGSVQWRVQVCLDYSGVSLGWKLRDAKLRCDGS